MRARGRPLGFHMATQISSPGLPEKILQPVATTATMPRLDSVDLLRGGIMVVMALDHTRDFLTHLRFPPERMAQTWPALFFMRWITHFCAPLFFFLAGTAAFLAMRRGRTPQQLSRFLWTRGLWLVFLELTIQSYIWAFDLRFHWGGVISALGLCMILLAALVRLPVQWVGAFGVAMIAGHNLLDGIKPQQLGSMGWLWTILHSPGILFWIVPKQVPFFVAYVLIPWVGVMAAGYALGAILTRPPEQRRRLLATIGAASVLLFCLLRATNVYGNPHRLLMDRTAGDFRVQPTAAMTVVSFLNTEKYPPSLQFLLMTLGPGLLALALFDRYNDRLMSSVVRPLVVFGRVPLFFYMVHILVVHLGAVGIALLFHQPAKWLLHGAIFLNPIPNGYGHNLPFIYLAWVTVCIALYFPCRWFANVKRQRRDVWWLSYL